MNINFFMNKAINQAKIGFEKDEVPVGAVLVDNITNKIVSSSYNCVNFFKNATSHAELLIINEACKKLNSKFLDNTSLFVTLEPCAMCSAAISETHIKRVYFGAFDEKKGSLESIIKLYNQKHYYVPEVYGGICEKECSELLKNFFRLKRK